MTKHGSYGNFQLENYLCMVKAIKIGLGLGRHLDAEVVEDAGIRLEAFQAFPSGVDEALLRFPPFMRIISVKAYHTGLILSM